VDTVILAVGAPAQAGLFPDCLVGIRFRPGAAGPRRRGLFRNGDILRGQVLTRDLAGQQSGMLSFRSANVRGFPSRDGDEHGRGRAG